MQLEKVIYVCALIVGMLLAVTGLAGVGLLWQKEFAKVLPWNAEEESSNQHAR